MCKYKIDIKYLTIIKWDPIVKYFISILYLNMYFIIFNSQPTAQMSSM